MSAHRMTRAEQETDTVYVLPDGSAFWTPDGEGRYWSDAEGQAVAEIGGAEHCTIVYLDADPEDC